MNFNMKNTIYILSLLILFQSCYSYKTFDLNRSENLVSEKVKIELKDSRKFKGKITELKKDIIKIKNSDKIIEIPISQITKIKGRKFSWLKTYALGASISFTLLVLIFNSLMQGIGDAAFNGVR